MTSFLLLCFLLVPVGSLFPEEGTRCIPPWAFGREPLAFVEKTCQLSPAERGYCHKNEAFWRESLIELIGEEYREKELPRISFCFSGGGYRAMVSSLGFMQGAEEIGLLPATSHVATLSGSAWMLAYLLVMMHVRDCSVEEAGRVLKEKLSSHILDVDTFNVEQVLEKVLDLFDKRGAVEWADIWGILLANTIFSDLKKPQHVDFSVIRDALNDSDCTFPFPLFALALSDVFPYEWLEVNPFVIGSDYLGCYIPTNFFDSPFKSGGCYRQLAERSLGWFLAMFGSAQNLSLGDFLIIFAKEKNNPFLVSLFQKIVDKLDLHETRAFSSPVNNFVWKMDGVPLAGQKHCDVSDGGVAFNIPFPFILREHRRSDIIFVCDASSYSVERDYRELYYAQEYAIKRNIKFPPLNRPKKIGEYIFVFEDELDATVPTVVYFANSVAVSTLELQYPRPLFDQVHDTMKSFLVDNRSDIVEVIQRKIDRAFDDS